jgi:hypothetical protein
MNPHRFFVETNGRSKKLQVQHQIASLAFGNHRPPTSIATVSTSRIAV